MFRQKMRTFPLPLPLALILALALVLALPLPLPLPMPLLGVQLRYLKFFLKPLVVILPINDSGFFRVLGNCAFCFKNHPRQAESSIHDL